MKGPVSVVVPWRADGEERGANWAWLRRRWLRLLPDATIVEGDSRGGMFSAAEAVNRAVSYAHHGLVVVAWADIAVTQDWIDRAITDVAHGDALAVTASVCCAIDRVDTIDLTHRPADTPLPPPDDATVEARQPGGWPGVAVTTRDVLVKFPFDERFDGRDYEGAAWLATVSTMASGVVTTGESYHLGHDRRALWQARGAWDRSDLFARYSRADGNPEAMTRVLDGSLSTSGGACR